MKLRIGLILIIVLAALDSAAAQFRTQRLLQMSKALGLIINDSIQPNCRIDSVAIYRGRPIRIKTNNFGDISNIGYKLFDNLLLESQKENAYIFDFIERYFLELDLRLDGRKPLDRMDLDEVVLVSGNIGMIQKINSNTQVSVEEIARRMFRFTWNIEGKDLTITFPSSNQLILGANIIELENLAEKDIERCVPMTTNDFLYDWKSLPSEKSQGLLVVEGGSYISEMIRGDIFLTEKDGQRSLFLSPNSPVKTVSNIMVTGLYSRELPLDLTINKYGHKKSVLRGITLQQYVSFCKNEGCKLFFGIKKMNENNISCTLFAFNEKLAYDHLLSVEFPLSVLRGEDVPIKATAYLYIPLHDLKEEFFTQFKKNNYEK